MKLMTQETRKLLPRLGATEEQADPIVQVKYFTPDGSATWLIIEFDGGDMLYGFCCLGDPEMAEFGFVLLSEIAAVRGALGLPVERDLYFIPKPVSEAIADIGC